MNGFDGRDRSSAGGKRPFVGDTREVLLLVDEGEHGPGLTDRVVAEQPGFSRRTVERIRERCVTEGRDLVRERKQRSRERSRRLDGEGEARLISLAGSKPPDGHLRWTLPLLADRLVEWEGVDSISHEWVRQVLKKTSETLAQGQVVHAAETRCGFCRCDGTGTDNLSTTPGPGSSDGLHG